MTLLKRGAVVGAVVGTVLLTGGSATAAQDEVTITLEPEQVTWLCEHRLPGIESRSERWVERINGDAETRGSAEWLRARAERARDAGRETTAELLAERAERRAGRVDELRRVQEWAQDFRAEHCG